jgi:hypothetical protein
MALPGVVGTAIGEGQGGQPIMLVLVEYGAVPGIPQQLDGVSVSPLVTGKIEALPKGGKPGGGESTSAPASRWPRPVPIGVSTGNANEISAGTIACRVKDGSTVYALSNNHVYARQNNATVGEEVLQPGRYDGGVPGTDHLGNLTAFVPIVFRGNASNRVDAAIAGTTTGYLGSDTPSDGYGTPSVSTTTATVGMEVQKYGRTTALTRGTVAGINVTVKVSYSRGVARFVGQILITPGSFSAAGDSGSLIVTQNGNNPVGLLFAGSSTTTIANPIDAVLASFNVAIDDGK